MRSGAPEDTAIELPDGSRAPLGSLRELVEISPGATLGYATDLRDTPGNRAALERLFAGAHLVFLEASFAADEPGRAWERAHLTTRAAGEIARAAGARRIEPFHFSPRYEGEEERMMREVEEAFSAG